MVFGVIFQNNARTLRERGLAVYSAVAYLCRGTPQGRSVRLAEFKGSFSRDEHVDATI